MMEDARSPRANTTPSVRRKIIQPSQGFFLICVLMGFMIYLYFFVLLSCLSQFGKGLTWTGTLA